MDIAEQRLQWLLEQRGYRYWTEDQLEKRMSCEITTRPDFYVETPITNLLVEVESFKERGPIDFATNNVGVVNPEKLFNRLRNSVKCAAKQLKPYSHLGIPLLVVLDNWRQISIPTDIIALLQIFGTLAFSVRVGEKGDDTIIHQRNARLSTDRHTYISAVAINLPIVRYLDDEMKSERPMRLRIIHNPFAINPLPYQVFNLDEDEQFQFRNNTWEKF